MSTKIQLIIGSTRQNRIAPQFAAWIESQVAKNSDIELEVVDLLEWQLPFLDAAVPPAYGPVDTPEAKTWASKIEEAEGYIFLTAEYNRSIPAPLKNALDYLVSEWEEKPAAIVSYGYIDGGAKAAAHLHDVLSRFRMKLAEPVSIHIDGAWLEDGKLTNAEVKLADYAAPLQSALKALAA